MQRTIAEPPAIPCEQPEKMDLINLKETTDMRHNMPFDQLTSGTRVI